MLRPFATCSFVLCFCGIFGRAGGQSAGDAPPVRVHSITDIGHEATHSWVLPFAEPLWNEGIATYVGILVGRGGSSQQDERHAMTSHGRYPSR
jgi:hypothetical protein